MDSVDGDFEGPWPCLNKDFAFILQFPKELGLVAILLGREYCKLEMVLLTVRAKIVQGRRGGRNEG